MKKLIYLMLLAVMFAMTSCIDIVEELTLKKNGSGIYVITMDMSSLMAEGVKEMLQGMTQEGEGEDALANMPSELDTIILFSNAPDSVRKKFLHPEILKKISLRTQISESKKLMKMTFAIHFDKLKEIDYFLEDLHHIQGSDGALPSMGSGGMFPSVAENQSLFGLKRRKLTRFNPPKEDNTTLEGEELEMLKMFFSDASYTSIYHLPGRVKKTTIPNAQVEGKTLKVVTPLMDILEGKSELGGWICFKRR